MELRQGPLGLRATPSARTASTHPLVRDDDGDAGARVLARGARRRGRAASQARQAPRRGVLTGGRLTARGRLRLRQVRPGRAGHQRRRLPRPAALGRGGAAFLAARGRRARTVGVTYADLEAAPAVLLVGLRARGGVADRLPAAAQGGPQAAACGSLASRRSPPAAWTKLRGARCCPRVPGAEADGARRARRRGDRSGEAVAEAGRGCCAARGGHPGRRAAGRRARRAVRGGPPRRRRPAPGSPGSRAGPASAARSRRVRCRRCCPAAARSADAAARVEVAAVWGVDRPAGRRRAATPAGDPRRPPRPASSAALRRRRRRPARPARPGGARWPRSTRRLRGQPGAAASAGHRPGRRRAPGRGGRRRRPAPSSTGRAAAAPVRPPSLRAPAPLSDVRVLDVLADELGVRPRRCPTSTAARAELDRLGPWDGAARPVAGAAAARTLPGRAGRARPCSPPGACCSTRAGCRTASRTSPAPPRRPSPGCRPHRRRGRRRRRRRARPSPPTRGVVTLPLVRDRRCPTASSGCRPTPPGSRRAATLGARRRDTVVRVAPLHGGAAVNRCSPRTRRPADRSAPTRGGWSLGQGRRRLRASLMLITLFTIWFERRVVGRMQQRIGPNRAGPFGPAAVASPTASSWR